MSKILFKLYSWFPFRPEDGILPVAKSVTFFLNHSSKGRQLCTASSADSHQLWHEGLSPLVQPVDHHVGDPPLIMVMLFSVIPIPCLSLALVLSLPVFSFQGSEGVKGKKYTKPLRKFCWLSSCWGLGPSCALREQVQEAGHLVSCHSRSDRERKMLLKEEEGEICNLVSFVVKGKIN